MVPDLPAGANIALPGAALGIALDGPFDLSALVLSASGAVAGDADMVFFNQPDAPGVRLRGAQLTVRPEALRRGAERVVVVASPEDLDKAVRTLPPVLLTDARERPFARFRPPPMPTQTVALLVEVYRRAGAWRVRAVGQGYADGLAGLARDFGVDVAEDGAPPAGAPGRPNGGAGGGGGGAADADLGQVAVEDVRAVPRALHPASHHFLGAALTCGDVLGDLPVSVAGGDRSIPDLAAVRALVGEEAALHHVGAVGLGRGGEPGVDRERP